MGTTSTDTHRYAATVLWDDGDAGFVAVAPELPGCSAFGQTQGEALVELQDAIAAWIDAARTAGHIVPQPATHTAEV